MLSIIAASLTTGVAAGFVAFQAPALRDVCFMLAALAATVFFSALDAWEGQG